MTEPVDKGTPHTPLCCIAEVRFEEMDRRIEQMFADLNKRLDQRFELSSIAIQKAEDTMNVRLESMNQFRQQILDERSKFATRVEAYLVTMLIAMIMAGSAVIIQHLISK